jgi:hypothetical protein
MTELAARRLGTKLVGMKPRAMFDKSLFLAAMLGITGPLLAQGTPGSTPGKNSTNAAKPPAAEPVLTIPGMVLTRDKGGFLGLEIDPSTNTFKLSFYDQKKKPIAPDVAAATIRWFYHDTGKEKLIYALSPGDDGKSFTSPRGVEPPLPHMAVLFLFTDATSADPAEVYRNLDLASLGANG